jgi:hypothetical protein
VFLLKKVNVMANENNGSSTYPKEYIENLYSLGQASQLSFQEQLHTEETDNKKKLLKNFIINEMALNETLDQSEFDSEKKLLGLFKLLCFIQAWADLEETWDIFPNEFKNKNIRQSMKFKKDIGKPTRGSIHVGLFKLVCESLLQFKQVAKNAKNPEEEKFIKELLESLKLPSIESNTKKKLLTNTIKKFIAYKSFEFTPKNIEENFLEAGKLISAFTLWPEKFFNRLGMVIGLIAALASGLSTGGAIFILLISFSVPLGFVIPLALLIFLAGTRANFQLFSQYVPRFLQDLSKSGGVTEFINQQGKRVQLSGTKKFLLLPAAFFSVSVGIAAAAITLLEGTKMIALICPMLVVACPYLPAILLGILAGALLIGLSFVMFRAFIGILQSQFSWQEIKQSIKEKWQNLNFTKGLGYVFKTLVMLAAFFGLVYLDFTGTSTLAGLLGCVAADGITLAAIIGDLPFTIKTALAWCNSLFSKNDSNPNLTKDTSYYLGKILEFFSLIINALGNAALVFTGSCISRVASVACFMNSYASNRTQEDDKVLTQAREDATKKSLLLLKTTDSPKISKINIIKTGERFNPFDFDVSHYESESCFFKTNVASKSQIANAGNDGKLKPHT